MKHNTFTRKWIALLMALAMLLNAGFAAAEAQPAEQPAELFGFPWTNVSVTGNLPAEKPKATDDLYAAVNYDTIAEHQDGNAFAPMLTAEQDQKETLLRLIRDTSVNTPELEALRTFFALAADGAALAKADMSEADPYIARIMAAGSLQELNAVLLADDFPFSPYIFMIVTPDNLKGNNIVTVTPALSLTDDPIPGLEHYDGPISDNNRFQLKAAALNQVVYAIPVIMKMNITTDMTQAAAIIISMYNTEASYVSKIPNTKAILDSPYGAYAELNAFLTWEELDERCPSFPLTATLKKFGKDKSPVICTSAPDWLNALNDLWKEENLETLKTLTAFKVFMECAPYMSQDIANFIRMASGQETLIGDANGYNACIRTLTLSPLVAKLYAEYGLGSAVQEKLTGITGELVEVYRKLYTETTWISEASRANALEKLDNMVLNVLKPEAGYIDFSGLKLKPAEEGGTLMDAYLAIKDYRNGLENSLIGRPASADMVWRATSPAAVNAFYDPLTNSINILPAFVNSSYWWEGISDMEILGGIGTVIGHEMSHGFDFLGSQINAYGEGKPILEAEDVQNFIDRVDKIVAYYDSIEALPGMPTPGNSLKMENTADLMGVKAAATLAASRENADMKAFFEMYAKLYTIVMPLELAMTYLQIDTHAPMYLRVNVNARMIPQFADAFGVKEGDGMYVKPEDRLTLWGD